jgi:hypothetical protein
MKKISYKGYRFPLEIIQQAIWLYVRFTLSFRDAVVRGFVNLLILNGPEPCKRAGQDRCEGEGLLRWEWKNI